MILGSVSIAEEYGLCAKETGIPVSSGGYIIVLSSGRGGYGVPNKSDEYSLICDYKNRDISSWYR